MTTDESRVIFLFPASNNVQMDEALSDILQTMLDVSHFQIGSKGVWEDLGYDRNLQKRGTGAGPASCGTCCLAKNPYVNAYCCLEI